METLRESGVSIGGFVSTVQHPTTVTEERGLISLRDTAARVVRSRHGGGDHDDLVQEAWTRVAVALRQRPIEDPHAYTAGIAANLVRGWDRRDRRRQRRAPLLWIRPTVDAPDGQVVQDEEGAALATALERLPKPARDMLVAHVVHGLGTASLATEAGTSAGAVAACLARARAMLRVEYLIAFRRLPPLPDHCRRVCYAVSANDARREVRLDADGHIRHCPTCRSIAGAVRERHRPAMGLALALRLSEWGTRLRQLDWQQAGPRMGVAGGLVSVGAVGALVMGMGAPARTVPAAPPPVVLVAAPAPAASTPAAAARPVVVSAPAHRTRVAAVPAPSAPKATTPALAVPQVPAPHVSAPSAPTQLPALPVRLDPDSLSGRTSSVASGLTNAAHVPGGLGTP